MSLSQISELDLRYRSNFNHDENLDRGGEWVSGYEFLSNGGAYTGRAVDLAVSVCEGLITELGFHADDVWLGYGINTRNEFKYAALCRVDGVIMELGRIDQGAYINAYGLPYKPPVEVEFSNVDYEQLYRFDLQKTITVVDQDWPFAPKIEDIPEPLSDRPMYGDVNEMQAEGLDLPSDYMSWYSENAPIKSDALDALQYQTRSKNMKPTAPTTKTSFTDRIKHWATQPFVILVIAVLFGLCAFAMPEFWDFVLGGSILTVSKVLLNVALLLSGVWLCRVARALFIDGGVENEQKDLGGFVYLAVSLCIVAASLSNQ